MLLISCRVCTRNWQMIPGYCSPEMKKKDFELISRHQDYDYLHAIVEKSVKRRSGFAECLSFYPLHRHSPCSHGRIVVTIVEYCHCQTVNAILSIPILSRAIAPTNFIEILAHCNCTRTELSALNKQIGDGENKYVDWYIRLIRDRVMLRIAAQTQKWYPRLHPC